MCTVSYIPTSTGFILSSNRDESPLRSKSTIKSTLCGQKHVVFPTDILGGTWLAFSNHGEVLCLLNGAFRKHTHLPPYKMSRGIMLLSYFTYESFSEFLLHFDFNDIEPFTLIVCSNRNLYEFRWDGNKKYIHRLNASSAHVWSSCTLYTDSIQSERKTWFENFITSTPNPSLDDIKLLHRKAGRGDIHNDYIMNRDEVVKTISISHVNLDKNLVLFTFEDLENSKKEHYSLAVTLEFFLFRFFSLCDDFSYPNRNENST